MTTFNKSTLQNLWINGFVPQGSDYTNLIQSQVNIAETAEQDMAGPLSTTKLITPKVSATTLNVSTILSANSMNCQTTLVAASATITEVNATKVSANQYFATPTIISAAGTSQATAAAISATVGIYRMQGTSDGQTTGFRLPSPSASLGLEQVLIHEGTVSGNLWPNSGCKINALANNAAFAMAASTPYYVTYTQVSGYAVK